MTVDRDSTPDIAQYFNVSAYPSLMVIGDEREKVYRWSGYKRPEPFMAELDEALRRYTLYRNKEEWDAPDPRPSTIIDNAVVETIPAPSEDVPSGITYLGNELWVSQTGKLYRLNPVTARVRESYDLGSSVRGICSDGKVIYGMQYGWTAGLPTSVIDPGTGSTIREIVTEENKVNKFYGAHSIAWREKNLYVLSSFGISEVDPGTGEIVRTIEPEERLTALTWNGEHFVGGTREAIIFIDPETGSTLRKIPSNYPIRAIHYQDGVYYMMEQPIFGYNKVHERIRIWPETTLIYKVTLPD